MRILRVGGGDGAGLTEAWCRTALERVWTERPDRVEALSRDAVGVAEALARACAAGPGAAVETDGVPPVIHQLWIGPRKPPLDAMATWQRHNPSMQHVFWNEERLAAELPAADVAHAMTVREINGRADVLRYQILTRFGGVFIDADAICLAPLPPQLAAFDAWTCFEDERVRPGLFACGYMGASRGNALMLDLAARCAAMDLATFSQTHRAWEFVGNQLLTNVARLFSPRALAVLPSRCFIGTHHSGAASPGLWPQYATQLWGSTNGYDQAALTRT